MNEIEKLYENAGVEKFTFRGVKNPQVLYPPFTAEKQLELIKFLFNHNVYYDVDEKGNYWFHISDEIENSKYREFDEAIAECINKMWQDLTSEEEEQVKGILKA